MVLRCRRRPARTCRCVPGRFLETFEAVGLRMDLLSIARLPLGHDPGASYRVATAALQRWNLAIRRFGLFGGPLAAAND